MACVVMIHKHIPGAPWKVELVDGDFRVPCQTWWERIAADQHAADVAKVTGFPLVEGGPCPDCEEEAKRQEERLANIKPSHVRMPRYGAHAATATSEPPASEQSPPPPPSSKAPPPAASTASPDDAPV